MSLVLEVLSGCVRCSVRGVGRGELGALTIVSRVAVHAVSSRFLVVVMLLVLLLGPVGLAWADSGFSDIDEAGSLRPGVESLDGMGVLTGTECAAGEFCPDDSLERWVMAVWLVRVLDGTDPELSSARFADVDPEVWWAPFVERLAVLGVTVGCASSPARYCPHESVTRGQMATFLVRAFDLQPGPPSGFVDVGGNPHAVGIDALAEARVTAGCGTDPARYCPDSPVTRAQMATFIARALGLVPLPLPPAVSDAPTSPIFVSFGIKSSESNWSGDLASVGVIDSRGNVRRVVGDISSAAPTGGVVYNYVSWSPDHARFAFVTKPVSDSGDVAAQLFVVDADGSNLKQLTDFNGSEPVLRRVSWSPDSTRLAFVRGPGFDNTELFVADASGGYVKLLDDSGDKEAIWWSPDSKNVAFTEGICCTSLQLFVVNTDIGNPTQLMQHPDRYDSRALPLPWSPDGSRIIYPDGGQLFIADADGGNAKELTRYSSSPIGFEAIWTWSPDGSRVAYNVGSRGNVGLFVADADGSNAIHLNQAGSTAYSRPIVWSLDGSRLTYRARFYNQFQLFVVEADGSNVYQITPITSAGGFWWSPDGSRIAYDAAHGSDDLGSHGPLIVADADGSNPKQLTRDGWTKVAATWSPDGSRIVYTDAAGAFAAGGGLFVADADGNNPTQLEAVRSVRAILWSKDSRRVVVFGEDRGNIVSVFTLGTDGNDLEASSRTEDGHYDINRMVWSPDDTSVAYFRVRRYDSSDIAVLDVGKEEIPQQLLSLEPITEPFRPCRIGFYAALRLWWTSGGIFGHTIWKCRDLVT